jgi:hypothetical protein
VAGRNSEERRAVIERWTKDFEHEKEEERKRREKAEAQMNLTLLQQRLQENLNKVKEDKDKL